MKMITPTNPADFNDLWDITLKICVKKLR